jgi:hypothetical protein
VNLAEIADRTGRVKGTVAAQLALLALPLPPRPSPSQPRAQRNEPSSATTLWNPPLLTKVTVSLTSMVSVCGANALFAPPTLMMNVAACVMGAIAASVMAARVIQDRGRNDNPRLTGVSPATRPGAAVRQCTLFCMIESAD